MEIVIDIHEEEYEEIINSEDCGLHELTRAIANGTVLPKGHGNLIDTKEFIKAINDWADNIDNYGAYEELEIAKALLQNHAHTIIDADKEQKEPKRDNFDQQAKWLLNGLKIQINALADEKGNQLDLEDVMKIIDANKEQ